MTPMHPTKPNISFNPLVSSGNFTDSSQTATTDATSRDSYSKAAAVMTRIAANLPPDSHTPSSGLTGYLDAPIVPSPDAPSIVTGHDEHHRKYVRLQLSLSPSDDTYLPRWRNTLGITEPDTTAIGVITIFQRYEHRPDYWTAANNTEVMLSTLFCPSALNEFDAQRLWLIIDARGQPVRLTIEGQTFIARLFGRLA